MQEELEQGFLITGEWLDIRGKHFLRFMGTGTMGSFEFVISNFKPYFYVDQKTPANLTRNALSRSVTSLITFEGAPVDRVEFGTYDAFQKCQRQVEQSSWNTFEADVKPTDRYLMDLAINASFEIRTFQDRGPVGELTRYLNPTITAKEYKPEFKVLSLDIETGRDGSVLSIGLHSWHTDSNLSNEIDSSEVLMRGELNGSPRQGFKISVFDTEKSLLVAFGETISLIDPDIIIGWNVIDFDFAFLADRCAELRVPTTWGRLNGSARVTKGGNMGKRINMNGRQVIDGPNTLRMAFYKFESFKLESVAQDLLGRGKDIHGGAEGNSWDEIERRFKEDKYALAYYNILDCQLVSDIFKKTDLITLQSTRSRISGLLMGRVGLSTAAFDHFFIPKATEFGLVAKNVRDVNLSEHAAGGHVLEPKVGIFKHVIVLDFKSLYPSIFDTFKIDPISLYFGSEEKNSKKTPTDHLFNQTKYALPRFIKELLAKRQYAKEQNDPHLSQAIKILMNSFYGVMGSGGSRFYHPHLPSAITGTGRWILKTTEAYLKSAGYEVIYGDTDSVFVCLNSEDFASPFEAGESLAVELNRYFDRLIIDDFGVESRLEVEFEKYYRSFFLPPSRSKSGGSKKRYAGLLVESKDKPDSESIQFTGLEYVRSDWTRAAKDFQYELMRRVFHGIETHEWIREFVQDLKDGNKNKDLVYQKRLTKPAEEYTKSRPPHVKAALLMTSEERTALGRRPKIEYIVTGRGPIPVSQNHDDIDFEHYVTKQVKPIADSVLYLSGEKFDDVIHGKQQSLFD